MNTIATIVSKSFAVGDKIFATRAEAEAFTDQAARTARVQALFDSKLVAIDAGAIAALGKDLIATLTLPSKMGPKPKAAAAA